MTIQSRAFALLPSMMVLLMLLTGCAAFFQDIEDQIHRQKYQADYQTFDQIMTVYDKGDFDVALVRFNALANSTASPKLARDARLGELCCRLIMADSPEAYKMAMDLWHEVAASAKQRGEAFNPILVDPLIVHLVSQRLAESSETQLSMPPPDASREATQSATAHKTEKRRLKAEIAVLKKKNEQVDELQQQLDEVMAENQSLKEKIKALEAIDQIIQKKKTEISEPNE